MTPYPTEPLKRAADILGSTAELARRLGVTPQAIYQWDRVPAERVLAIEAATCGAVSRHDLRPDLYPREAIRAGEASAARAVAGGE